MKRRLLRKEEDSDPMSVVSNLFDVAMVFAVALMVALVHGTAAGKTADKMPAVHTQLRHIALGPWILVAPDDHRIFVLP